MLKKKVIVFAITIFLVIPSIYLSEAHGGANIHLNEEDCPSKSMVYILPYKNCTDYWTRTYGDRIYYYVYGNLSHDRWAIEEDFENISAIYDRVIIVIPAEDTTRYLRNLNVIDSVAEEFGMQVIYAIFPKEKYGDEDSYLDNGTEMHSLVLYDMSYMINLSQTYKVAVWYGWTYRCNATDIVNFYNSLPQNLQGKYAVWLDEEYVEGVKDVYNYGLPRNILFITEAYDKGEVASYSTLYSNQMLVTGYEGASSLEEWRSNIENLLSVCRTNDVGIWIFYDIGDGAGEECAAFINGNLTDFNFSCNIVWEKAFYPGWNFITLPCSNNYTASSLYNSIEGCNIILKWNNSKNDFDVYVHGSPYNFAIENGVGYFISVSNNTNFSTRGVPIARVNITLLPGWNSLGWFNSTQTNASSIYNNIAGCNIVLKWNNSKNGFDVYVPSSPNFVIEQGDGFFVSVSQQSQWHG